MGALQSRIHFSISVRHSSAGGENGYAVSGVGEREAKGCVDAKLAKMPVVWSGWVAQLAPTLLWRFRLPVRTSASSSIDCLTAFRRAGRNARRVCRKLPGAMRSSRTTRRRHIHPIKATVATETPSGADRNTHSIIGIYLSSGHFSSVIDVIMWVARP